MEHLIVMHELEGLSEQELLALYRKVYNIVVASERNSPDRRNALASLENIIRALNNLRARKYDFSHDPEI